MSVAIDLARFRFGEVAGQPTPLQDGLVVEPRQPVDLAVLLPAEATLRLRADGDAAVTASFEIDGRWQTLAPRRFPHGGVRAALPAAEGQPVRLRFEASDGARVVLARARVVGRERQRAPALPAAVRPPAGPPVNVIIFLVDALRADHLSLYGYGRPTTPRLAELVARGGVVFEQAYAAGPNTANSIPALFTSRYASELGANFLMAPAATRTLAEVFETARWDTAAFTVNPLLARDFGYARGFRLYQLLRLSRGAPRECCPPTDQIQTAADRWLARPRRVPFFLYLHTLDVHQYAPAPAFRGRFAGDGRSPEPAAPRRTPAPGEASLGASYRRLPGIAERITIDAYDEAIASVDEAFGRFVEALGPARERTLVVFTADHGEALGNEDDGSWMHGQSLHEEQVHVPLVVLAPWLGRALRVDEVVSLLDVAPTLADLAGLAPAPSWRGRSLLRPTGATRPPAAVFERLSSIGGREPLLAPGIHRVASAGIREGQWKLIVRPAGPALYDLVHDAKEARNLADARAWEMIYLADRTWSTSPALRTAGFGPAPTAPATTPSDAAGPETTPGQPAVREQLRDALEALGYVE